MALKQTFSGHIETQTCVRYVHERLYPLLQQEQDPVARDHFDLLLYPVSLQPIALNLDFCKARPIEIHAVVLPLVRLLGLGPDGSTMTDEDTMESREPCGTGRALTGHMASLRWC